MFGFSAGAIEHHKLHHFREFVETMPRRQARNIVFADQIEKFSGRLVKTEHLYGLDRIGRRRALQFHFIQQKFRFILKRDAQHFQTDLGRTQLPLEFVRRGGGRHENQFVEPECFNRLTRQDQVPVMDRIECSAEDGNPFQDVIVDDGSISAPPAKGFLFRVIIMKPRVTL